MGTNFYRVKDPLSFSQEIANKYIETRKLLGKDSLNSYLDSFKEQIHICKRSAGWKILFDHNNYIYYKDNREALNDFLKEPGYIIQDEYGEQYSLEAFWKMVDDWNTEENNTDSNFSYTTDGLRWAHYTDFA